MYNCVNTDIICPECGEAYMTREEPKVIKSSTETYTYLCTHCGFVHTAKSDEDMKEWIKSLDKPTEEEILKEQVQAFIGIVDETTDSFSSEPDMVNHPPHYNTGKFESIDVMKETQGVEAVQDFCICNAFKYIYRHKFKNGVEDIRKAKWCIDTYLELEKLK